jgi:hypothetical protein
MPNKNSEGLTLLYAKLSAVYSELSAHYASDNGIRTASQKASTAVETAVVEDSNISSTLDWTNNDWSEVVEVNDQLKVLCKENKFMPKAWSRKPKVLMIYLNALEGNDPEIIKGAYKNFATDLLKKMNTIKNKLDATKVTATNSLKLTDAKGYVNAQLAHIAKSQVTKVVEAPAKVVEAPAKVVEAPPVVVEAPPVVVEAPPVVVEAPPVVCALGAPAGYKLLGEVPYIDMGIAGWTDALLLEHGKMIKL